MKIDVLQPMKYKNEANTTMNICYTDIYDMEELDNRRLYINNDINCEIIDTIVYHILRFNRIDKDKKPEERKPILLYINSPGGGCLLWLWTYLCYAR